jgi:hypothetical protein
MKPPSGECHPDGDPSTEKATLPDKRAKRPVMAYDDGRFGVYHNPMTLHNRRAK